MTGITTLWPRQSSGTSALAVYETALRKAAARQPATLTLEDDRGDEHHVDPRGWCRDEITGDAALLDRCDGPTLDVGCGPGRLTTALTQRGRAALGVDVSAVAVRLARQRGAAALRRDVFDPLPADGRWQHLLLADGNIGIGGNPCRLLRRCHDLLARGGHLHVELAAPGTRTWSGAGALRDDSGASAPLRWASVAAPDLAEIAATAGLCTVDAWTEAGRWFASLVRA